MADLSDEQLEWRRAHAMSTSESEFQAVIVELQRHRAAQRADAERVKAVVRDAMRAELKEQGCDVDHDPDGWMHLIEAASTRVAERLASAAPVLSASDRVRLRSVRDLLAKQPVCWDSEQAMLDRLLGAAC